MCSSRRQATLLCVAGLRCVVVGLRVVVEGIVVGAADVVLLVGAVIVGVVSWTVVVGCAGIVLGVDAAGVDGAHATRTTSIPAAASSGVRDMANLVKGNVRSVSGSLGD